MQGRKAASIALIIIAWASRTAAILLCCLTALLCFGGMSARLNITGLVIDLTRTIPSVISGYGLMATPFGGVFRLDFVLIALFLFILDYLCCRLSRKLRENTL